jgi:hypothetical protein
VEGLPQLTVSVLPLGCRRAAWVGVMQVCKTAIGTGGSPAASPAVFRPCAVCRASCTGTSGSRSPCPTNTGICCTAAGTGCSSTTQGHHNMAVNHVRQLPTCHPDRNAHGLDVGMGVSAAMLLTAQHDERGQPLCKRTICE